MNSVSPSLLQRRWYRPSLTTQIMIGLILGALIGWLRPDWGNKIYFLRDIFINLIKSIIAPLIFSTIVVGIAGAGALKKVGRIGIKALIFFEIVTTAALFIGLRRCRCAKESWPDWNQSAHLF
jgi:Na+/H+-dicarboxylate symporter